MTHLFFYVTKKFPRVINWGRNECAMKIVALSYKSKLENVRDIDIDRMMKNF